MIPKLWDSSGLYAQLRHTDAIFILNTLNNHTESQAVFFHAIAQGGYLSRLKKMVAHPDSQY